MSTNTITAIAVVVSLVIGAGIGYAIQMPEIANVQSELSNAELELETMKDALASPKIPEDAIQLTEIVPGMGEHWANPENLPLGPIYLVHDDEVIGLEFMYSEDMMQEITIPGPEGVESFLQLAGLPIKTFVDHVDMEFLPDGHDGFEVPHYDVHIYFISQEDQHKIEPHAHQD